MLLGTSLGSRERHIHRASHDEDRQRYHLTPYFGTPFLSQFRDNSAREHDSDQLMLPERTTRRAVRISCRAGRS